MLLLLLELLELYLVLIIELLKKVPYHCPTQALCEDSASLRQLGLLECLHLLALAGQRF